MKEFYFAIIADSSLVKEVLILVENVCFVEWYVKEEIYFVKIVLKN